MASVTESVVACLLGAACAWLLTLPPKIARATANSRNYYMRLAAVLPVCASLFCALSLIVYTFAPGGGVRLGWLGGGVTGFAVVAGLWWARHTSGGRRASRTVATSVRRRIAGRAAIGGALKGPRKPAARPRDQRGAPISSKPHR